MKPPDEQKEGINMQMDHETMPSLDELEEQRDEINAMIRQCCSEHVRFSAILMRNAHSELSELSLHEVEALISARKTPSPVGQLVESCVEELLKQSSLAARPTGFQMRLSKLRDWTSWCRNPYCESSPEDSLARLDDSFLYGLHRLICDDDDPDRPREADNRTQALYELLLTQRNPDDWGSFMIATYYVINSEVSSHWDTWLAIQPGFAHDSKRWSRWEEILIREARRFEVLSPSGQLDWRDFHLGLLLGCTDFCGLPISDEAKETVSLIDCLDDRETSWKMPEVYSQWIEGTAELRLPDDEPQDVDALELVIGEPGETEEAELKCC